MTAYVLIEESYKSSPWCRGILEGVLKECKSRKMKHTLLSSPSFSSSKDDLVIVVGSSHAWIYTTVSELKKSHPSHIVLISNRPYNLAVNNVSTDNYASMKEILSYLSQCGKGSVAFYGVNPSSASDNLRLSAFRGEGAVFYNRGNLKDCFEEFYREIDRFDGVICANDYAAVSLMQNCKEKDPALLDRLFIVSYANTAVGRLYQPSITSVSLNYREYGKAAIDLYSILRKMPENSTVNVNVRCQIMVRDTTKGIPFLPEKASAEPMLTEPYDFYGDREIAPLFALETVLQGCDDTDLAILRALASDTHYERIAEDNYLSVNGVKYRVKVLCESAGIGSPRELISLYKTYLGGNTDAR